MMNVSVIEQPLSPGIISIDMAGQVFTHKLRHVPLSPADNNLVLDLASPLYDPGATIDGVSKVYDRSGKGNHGTITGATWKVLPSGLWYLYFGGDGDYVDIGDPASLDISGAFTVLAWARTASDDTQVIFSKGGYGNNDGTIFYFSVKIPNFKGNGVGGNDFVCTADGAIGSNVWSFIVGVYTPGSQILYVNAVPQADTEAATDNYLDMAKDVYIGRHPDGVEAPMNGDIALFNLVNGVATPAQITSIFNQERHLFGV